MRAVPEHVVDGSVDAGLADRALLVPEVVELDGEQQVVALVQAVSGQPAHCVAFEAQMVARAFT